MYHQLGIQNNFNIPSDIFLNYSPRLSYFSRGNYVIDERVGPDTGFAISLNKKDTMLRAFAEVIERRSNMLGGKKTKDGMVPTWDLLNSVPSFLEYKYTTFNLKEGDTTGCAVHTNSDIAISNALKEIYEKNSLYLFWYGKQGSKVSEKHCENNQFYKCLITSGFSVSIFVNEYFSPLKVVIVLVYKADDLCVCGLGSSMDYFTALNHALEEAFLIGAFQYYRLRSGHTNNRFELTDSKKEYIKELETIKTITLNQKKISPLTVTSLVACCPNYIKEIHLVPIEQRIIPKLKAVKLYAPGLFHCLPLKENVTVNNLMNQNSLLLDEYKLKTLPECPMC